MVQEMDVMEHLLDYLMDVIWNQAMDSRMD